MEPSLRQRTLEMAHEIIIEIPLALQRGHKPSDIAVIRPLDALARHLRPIHELQDILIFRRRLIDPHLEHHARARLQRLERPLQPGNHHLQRHILCEQYKLTARDPRRRPPAEHPPQDLPQLLQDPITICCAIHTVVHAKIANIEKHKNAADRANCSLA